MSVDTESNNGPGDENEGFESGILLGNEEENFLVIPNQGEGIYEIWDNGEYDEVEINPD